MVSIPDWSRFGRLGEVQKETTSNSRFNKIRELKNIKQAEESGYFLHVDRQYIERNILKIDDDKKQRTKSFLKCDEEEIDLSGVYMIKLPGAHLRTVGDIGLCRNLQICILSNNFILRFDALVSCNYLLKLDLHGNQVRPSACLSCSICAHIFIFIFHFYLFHHSFQFSLLPWRDKSTTDFACNLHISYFKSFTSFCLGYTF